jgi:hypothetical protein
VAEVARILAIHVAHYQAKYGKVSMEETLKLLHSVTGDRCGGRCYGISGRGAWCRSGARG